jgi:hypothetical protein
VVFGFPGTTPSVSADGAADGIVWVVQDNGIAVLRAYRADDLAAELYDSGQAGGRDQLGTAVKFAVPTVVNGKVYVGTQSGLTVFGLVSAATPSPAGGVGAFVSQAYQDLLGRLPEPAGLAYWNGLLNQGLLTRNQVALAIASSPEYESAEVQRVYARFLHRSAEPEGLRYWTAFLQAGGTLEQLETGVASSPEYFRSRAGGTNEGYLTALYHDALGRDPDAAGQAGWGQALATGVSRAEVAAAVFASPEFLQDLVQSYYQQFLRRTGEIAGLNYWLVALHDGMTDVQVVAGFVGSQEYLNHLE